MIGYYNGDFQTKEQGWNDSYTISGRWLKSHAYPSHLHESSFSFFAEYVKLQRTYIVLSTNKIFKSSICFVF